MPARSCLVVFLLLVFTVPGMAQDLPGPVQVALSPVCDGNNFSLQLTVDNYDDFTQMTMDVRRAEIAPDMAGPLVLATGLIIPPAAQGLEFVFPDPGLGPEDVGIYEATVKWPDGSLYDVFSAQLSCTEEPYVMRGYLVTNDVFEPCTGLGLLECDAVTLQYGDMNTYVGTGELLEIYGWPQTLDSRQDCSVRVVRIDPLGIGVACEDVVPVMEASWSAVKAFYR